VRRVFGRLCLYLCLLTCLVSWLCPLCPPSCAYCVGFSPSSRPGQAQLYRILTAYANLDRRTGYCQGMNFLAGLLLAVGLPEVEAFYTFVSLMLR
jgi:hypothetical protein